MMNLIGMDVYDVQKRHCGTVVNSKQDNGKTVYVLSDGREVDAIDMDCILWTLKPDTRGEHLRLKWIGLPVYRNGQLVGETTHHYKGDDWKHWLHINDDYEVAVADVTYVEDGNRYYIKLH